MKKKLTEIERQERNGKFVANEVYVCQSTLVGKLLQEGVFSFDDIVNLYKTPDELRDEGYTEAEIEAGESDWKEVMEWWLVSDYMIRKLKEIGEPVLENDYGEWWGRQCSGQAVKMDYVIDRLQEV